MYDHRINDIVKELGVSFRSIHHNLPLTSSSLIQRCVYVDIMYKQLKLK